MPKRRGDIIVISSQVARGAVGNRGIVFALERLGYTVWAVPTVLMPYHPGHAMAERMVPDDAVFACLLDSLADRQLADVSAILTGYLASPGQAAAAATLVNAVKRARPDAIFVCDPVIGDDDHLYVPLAIASAIRDRLMPLADLATPNAFECAWLAARVADEGRELANLAAAARALPPPLVMVTSAPALMRGHIANLLVESSQAMMAEHRLVESDAKGTGDVLAALLTARLLEGHEPAKALEMASASILDLLALSARLGRTELALAEGQQALVQPRAPVNMRRLPTFR